MAVNLMIRRLALLSGLCLVCARGLAGQVSEGPQGVSVSFVDTDIRAAAQMLAPFLDRPVIFGALGGQRVSFVSQRAVPRGEVIGLLRALLSDQGYALEETDGGAAYRIRSTAAPAPGGVAAAGPQPAGAAPAGSLASAGGVELFVIRLRHARAPDVSATVNALYGRGAALGETGFRRGTLSDELSANREPPRGAPGAQPARAGAASGEFSGDVVIVPDARTNTLLVRANRADFELIRAAVEQVDVRPLQVLIEATVAYVRRDFNFRYGLQASTGAARVPGSSDATVGGELKGSGPGDLVISAMKLGGVDLDLILRAGQSRNSVIILDRPLVMAANNEEAEIVVGEQRPFVQVQRAGDGGLVEDVVQYKDVGTVLRVLPTISADGYVQLEVVQEVNSASGSAEGLNAPVISTRSIRTQVLLRDGHTVVMGGLSGRQRDRVRGGIPLLSDLPLIGGLFGHRGREDHDFELYVFITPRVLYTDEDLGRATAEVEARPSVRKATSGSSPAVQPAGRPEAAPPR